jgi:hypothetical protein
MTERVIDFGGHDVPAAPPFTVTPDRRPHCAFRGIKWLEMADGHMPEMPEE